MILIDDAQRDALRILAPALGSDLYLAGGVAVAVRLGHRRSNDLDLFMEATDPVTFVDGLARLPNVRILTRSARTVYLEVGKVPVSIIRYAYPLLEPTERIANLCAPVASSADLVAMKLSAIAQRGACRDFWDLHALLSKNGIALENALSAYRKKYSAEDIGHVVRSLVYFVDAEREPMPAGLTTQHWQAVKAELRRWVLELE